MKPVTGLNLSIGQEGIAFQQMMTDNAPLFTIPAALTLLGPMNQTALERALKEIRRRHDLLRSTFHFTSRGGTRTVQPWDGWALELHDLSVLTSSEQETAARSLVERDAARPFELEGKPAFRCFLIRLRHDLHIFYWCMHHIAYDGWSKSVFAHELSALYAQMLARPAATLDPGGTVVTYDDFVRSQRDQYQQAHLRDARQRFLSQWARRIAQTSHYSEIPPTRERPSRRTFAGEDVPIQIPASLRQEIAEAARAQRATPFMFAQVAWAILVNQLTANEDVLVSAPFGGRSESRFESVIGFFVQVLLLPAHMGAESTPEDLLQQARSTTLEALELAHPPFREQAQIIGQIPGGTQALTSTSLSFQSLPYSEVALPGMTVTPFRFSRVDVRYDLEMHLWDDGEGGYGGRLIYAAELFDRDSVAGWAADYITVLESCVREPQATLSEMRSRLRSRYPTGSHEPHEPDDRGGDVAVSPSVEALVHDIWCDLLDTDSVGPADNFFEVGGHSLLVALFVLRLKEETGIDLPVRDVFRDPTLRGVSQAIGGNSA